MNPEQPSDYSQGYDDGYEDGKNDGIRKALAEVEEEAARTFHNDEPARRHFRWVTDKVRITLNAPRHKEEV